MHVGRLGCLREQIRLTRLGFPTPEWSKNSRVERDKNYMRDLSLSHSSCYLTEVRLIKFPLTIFFQIGVLTTCPENVKNGRMMDVVSHRFATVFK